MSNVAHITDNQLPRTQDFEALKQEGLSIIQNLADNQWTHLNPSDPGVTILEQLCYALTELGYCQDFPVEDILTGKNNKLKLKNLFYRPDSILTTNPVTIDDLKKFILDELEEIENLEILPVPFELPMVSRLYQTYLKINQKLFKNHKDAKAKEDLTNAICIAVYTVLNRSRNIGELFLMPKALKQIPLKPHETLALSGKIYINNINNLKDILVQIQTTVDNFIFPQFYQDGYEQLLKLGLDTNNIFNGPKLHRAWIQTSSLKDKQTVLYAKRLSPKLEAIDGIDSIVQFQFKIGDATPIAKITIENDILPIFNVFDDFKQNILKFYFKGKPINPKAYGSINDIAKMTHSATTNLAPVNPITMAPKLPTGKFRDINSYYSVQNTFPQIYAVGKGAIDANTSKVAVAQSRQLKGYLTLFDQLLANQFSQLASIGELFSFRNSLSGNPTDMDRFYETKDTYQKEHLEYPSPYLTYSPTYYYQSLYEVPDIQPLLKDAHTFDFGTALESEKKIKAEGWKAYKQDPYNAYMRGLMNIMEEQNISFERRNNILDHLLARHGESPYVIDKIIEGTTYTGSDLKDKIILKSLLLQNLDRLSYFRQKAYNFQGAHSISPKMPTVDQAYYENLRKGYSKNYVFDSGEINQIEKIKGEDIINYSMLELKLCMLFGLRGLFNHFILNNYKPVTNIDEVVALQQLQVNQALWMIQQRRGLILIETDLLYQSAHYDVAIMSKKAPFQIWEIAGAIDYITLINLEIWLQNNKISKTRKGKFRINLGSRVLALMTKSYPNRNLQLFESIPESNYSINITIKGVEKRNQSSLRQKLPANKLLLFFPDYLFPSPKKTTVDLKQRFEDRVDLFLAEDLPIGIDKEIFFQNYSDLAKLITAFSNWHNSMIKYTKDTDFENLAPPYCTDVLINEIIKITD